MLAAEMELTSLTEQILQILPSYRVRQLKKTSIYAHCELTAKGGM